ncbi:DUF1236 domain-containing protein [Microvirga thermotolerans]|uniref:DUF1236 domain-containing protein n=1 Tax=Microvirga thermotolerans TaxID=2651334 RepID=A0A5P9JXG6_9HYPH|nr:DUF1236 domain-containing protein [Microvirga thermotolerans]QFU17542.1 DUF1236 domain-containing protein [Microvirga thermotolerans]
MKYYVSSVVAVLALAGVATAAAAQSTTVTISPEEETTVTKYVTERRLSSVDVPGVTSVTVGTELPSSVELHTVPNVQKYRVAVIKNKTVLVDPGTHKVVKIIETK